MDEEIATNPVEGEITPETEVETEVQTEEPQLDDDGNPIEDQAEPEEVEEDEEVDVDGVKLKLPKSQAEQVRKSTMLNADYTRKTQALADERKAWEAERDTLQQADVNEQSARANLHLIDTQIDHYSKIDWNAFNDEDPFGAQKAFQQFQLLKDARSSTAGYLEHLSSERQSAEQRKTDEQRQSIAKLLDDGTPELKKAIPDWGRPKAAKLVEDARKLFGVDDLDPSKPSHFLLLNAAVERANDQAKQKKAQTLEKQQEVVPAAKAASGKSSVPPGKLDDRLSKDEWMKRRNAQARQA